MQVMAAPMLEPGPPGFSQRLGALLAAMPAAADDRLDAAALGALTQAAPDGADSLHRLVIDLHDAPT